MLVWLATAFALLGPAPLARAAGGDALARGTSEPEREYQIKAAFLLNFIRYTTWPKSSFEDGKSPIVVLVVGEDPFGEALEATFKDEQANGRRIELRRSPGVPETVAAHLAFCGTLTPSERVRLLAACAGRPVLLVGDRPGLAEDGACINFYLEERKTRFEINVDALAEARLELSPAVLKLAKIVHTRREG